MQLNTISSLTELTEQQFYGAVYDTDSTQIPEMVHKYQTFYKSSVSLFSRQIPFPRLLHNT